MAKFKDCRDREWTLTLTNGDLRTVREDTGIELGKILANKEQLTELLFGEAEKLGRIIWVLCEEQVAAAGLDERAFAKGFDGPTNERVRMALLDAIIDFYPRSAAAQAIKRGMGRMMATMDGKLVEEIDQIMEEALRTLSEPSGNSPDSSRSTPAP